MTSDLFHAPLLPSGSEHHRTLADTHSPSHRGQEAEFAWVASYIPRCYDRPKTVTHLSTNRPIVRRPTTELTTIVSQVQHVP